MNFDNIRMCNLQFNLKLLFCTMGKKRKKIQMNGRYTMYKMYIKKIIYYKSMYETICTNNGQNVHTKIYLS